MATWTGNRVEVKALIGRPAFSDVPPGAKAGTPPRTVGRRGDWISGSEFSIRPFSPVKVGGTFVYVNPKDDIQDPHQVWSALGEMDFGPWLEKSGIQSLYGGFYGEYARRAGGPEGHGLYLSGNFGGQQVGLSLEYKDYENLALRFNDPPSLIREHTAFLLNRSTHVLLTLNEKGYQAEGTFTQPGWATYTVNVSYAKNDLAANIPNLDLTKTLKERYLGVDIEKWLPVFSATAFFDWGKNQIEGIEKRRVGGIILETSAWSDHTLGLDMEAMRSSRPFGTPQTFWDTYTAVSWQHPGGVGAAVTLDRTTDPFEVDRLETPDIETGSRIFWSLNLNARFGGRYNAVLFAGERRGGTACTSGTCYQVLPFKGLEMRINSYF